MMKVTVACTNCNGTTEVPAKYESNFTAEHGSGLCEDCHEAQKHEVIPPRPVSELSGYEQVMRDMKAEYQEKQQELARQAQQEGGPIKTLTHNPDLNRL